MHALIGNMQINLCHGSLCRRKFEKKLLNPFAMFIIGLCAGALLPLVRIGFQKHQAV